MGVCQLVDLYDQKCAMGILASDPYQREALVRLVSHLEALRGSSAFWRGFWYRYGWRFLKGGGPSPRGLYLYGKVGRGKTMLMDLFFQVAPEPKLRYHFHDFLQKIHQNVHSQGASQKEGALEGAIASYGRSCRLLCLDELEVADIADAMILSKILMKSPIKSQEQGMHIVVTSNRHPQDLYVNGLHRERFLPTIGYIMDNFDVVSLDGSEDYRQKIVLPQGEIHYISPCTPETGKSFEVLFTEVASASLTEGVRRDVCAPLEPLKIEAWGRVLMFPKQCQGVVMIPFADLCGTPHGAADYLALSQQIGSLFLDEVPKFSLFSRDEMRRFILLVDVLYDRKIPLFLRAQDPLETLYVMGSGEGRKTSDVPWTFELMRTCSRLREMQFWFVR